MTGVRVRRALAPALAVALAPALVALAGARAAASPEARLGRAADLKVRRLPAPAPAHLGMRRALATRAASAAAATTAADPAADADADPDADIGASGAEAQLSGTYRPIPHGWRDVQERVVFHMNVGVGIATGDTSGDIDRDGTLPGDVTDPRGNGFRGSRQYVLGDAVLGTRGVLMPSLETYFLSRFKLDMDGATRFSALNDVYDTRGGRALLVSAGYAELDGLGKTDSALSHFYVRAGRQFRYGAATYVANFDGLTAGYRDPRVDVSGFVGRRVSLYFGDDPGVLAGAGAVLHGKEMVHVPVDVALDYLGFGGGDIGDTRHFVEATARTQLPAATRLTLRARYIDTGDGDPGLGHLAAEVRTSLWRQRLVAVASVEQRFARELSYDFLGAAPTDVVAAPTQLGIALEPPGDSTLTGVRADLRLTPAVELYGFARANLAEQDSATSLTQTSWAEAGAAAGWSGGPLTASAQVKIRAHQLDGDANQAGSGFDNTAGSGEEGFREVAGEARYRLGQVHSSLAVGGYVRVYDVRTPYAEVDSDGRGGARVDADYWFNQKTRVKLAGEVAQPSPSFAAEIGTLSSVRLIMEAAF